MDYPNNTTEHIKWKHLKYEDYVLIQMRLKDGWKANRIAKEIGCAPNTVRKIIQKGMTPLYNGKVQRFKAKTAWKQYKSNRTRCGRRCDFMEKRKFLKYVEQHFRDDHWSMDSCAGRAVASKRFQRSETLCTKTLYNYIDYGLLQIKSIDLPVRVSRRTKKQRVRKNKRILGRSIEERPEDIDKRTEFGHWEIDLVVGKKSAEDEVLLTMIERKTRSLHILRLRDKSADSVMEAFSQIKLELGDRFDRVFRSITTDNGSEFSRLSELEIDSDCMVFYAHPYTSCEKGSIENHNGLIRRFIRKGKQISDYTDDDILYVELWANSLPRKILGYRTPDEAFDDEMDLIYAA